MAWSFYYHYPKANGEAYVRYDCKHPPNSSVSETFTTYEIVNGKAKLSFLEYDFYDLDPDGVREAYGCLYESRYTLTVDDTAYDPETLFVYTVLRDGGVQRGGKPDPDAARAIFVFSCPIESSDEALLSLTREAENLPKTAGEVETLILCTLLDGRDDGAFLAAFYYR